MGDDRDPQVSSGVWNPPSGQKLVGQKVPAFVHLSQDVAVRHSKVIEEELGGGVGPHHGYWGQAEARRVVLHYEGGDAPAGLGIGAGEHDAPIAPQCTAYKDLAAVDNPVIAVADGPGLDGPGGIGPASGLGDGEPGLSCPPHGGQAVSLNLVGSTVPDDLRGRGAHGAVDGGVEAGSVLHHLLFDDYLGEYAQAPTIELLGHSNAPHAHVLGLGREPIELGIGNGDRIVLQVML